MKMTRFALALAMLMIISLFTGGRACAQAPVPAILSVSDFGAVPNDGKDDTAAVFYALRACHTAGANGAPVTLIFPPGVYNFAAGQSPIEGGHAVTNGGVSAGNLQRFTLDGQGSTFAFSGLQQAMSWTNCSGLTLKNIFIDWPRPPFSQGWVTAVAPDAMSFDVRVGLRYPVTGTEPILAFQAYDPQARAPLGSSVVTQYTVIGTQLTAPQCLHVTLNKPCTLLQGNLIVMRHAMYNYDGCFLSQCSNVLLQNVTIYTCPGMGLMANHCTNVTLAGFNVCRLPGSNRLMSSTADATHFIACQGTLEVDNCLLENQGDDGLNVGGKYYTIVSQIDASTVQCAIPDQNAPGVGDTFEFTSGTTLAPLGSALVASVTKDASSNLYVIGFSSPISVPLTVGTDMGIDTTWLPTVHIAGCTARNNRGRGFVIRSRNAVIENNTFDHVSGPGVDINCSQFWMEGPASQNVTVRNNNFNECNNTVYAPHGGYITGTINIHAQLGNQYDSTAVVHQNITLQGNRVHDTDHTGIYISSADGCLTDSNMLTNCNRLPTRFLQAGTIGLSSSSNLNIQNNAYTASDGSLGTFVEYGGLNLPSIWMGSNPGFAAP